MPADVEMGNSYTMWLGPRRPLPPPERWNTEHINGNMSVEGPTGTLTPVRVIVYRTLTEHFAVLWPRNKNSKPLAVLNLRNIACERRADDTGFRIRHRDLDTTYAIEFHVDNIKDLNLWLHVFSPRIPHIIHQNSLPIVEEEEDVDH